MANIGISIGLENAKLQNYRSVCQRDLIPLRMYIPYIRRLQDFYQVLQQIASAIQHIHNLGGSHGNISLETIFVSSSEFMIRPTAGYFGAEEVVDGKEKDIDKLGVVFEEVKLMLVQGEFVAPSNESIWSHLLRSMEIHNARQLDAQGVINHPFFWNVEKKLAYLCKVARRCKFSKDMRNNLDANHFSHVFGKKGWISHLGIFGQDHETANRFYENATGIENGVSRATIRELAAHNDYIDYDETSLSSLLRFIRNIWEHLDQQIPCVRACFNGDDDPITYWYFFTNRLPELFPVVYDLVRN